jgi:hypothetical protein
MSLSLSTLKDHLIQALATAALLGGGATIVQSKVDNARQDAAITAQQAAMSAIPEIQKDVKATREAVIRLEAKQEK